MKHGWISLPIIILLLAVAALSMAYQRTLLASYQWLAQLKESDHERPWLDDFEQAFVVSPHFASATKSACKGFCGLDAQLSQTENTWRHDALTLSYQWRRFSDEADGSSAQTDSGTHAKVSYRLCVTQNHRQYLCWWWRDGKLLGNGRVSAAY